LTAPRGKKGGEEKKSAPHGGGTLQGREKDAGFGNPLIVSKRGGEKKKENGPGAEYRGERKERRDRHDLLLSCLAEEKGGGGRAFPGEFKRRSERGKKKEKTRGDRNPNKKWCNFPQQA